MKISHINVLSYLIASIPVLLISGPFLPDLIISLSSLIFLIFIIYNKRFYIFNNKLFILFFIFYLICLLSSFFSDYIDEIIFKNIAYIRFGILILIIEYLIVNSNNFVNLIKKVLIFCLIVLFFDSIFQFINGKNIFGFSHPAGRITSFFHDESVIGSYTVRLIPLILCLIYFSEQKLKKTLPIFMMGTSIIVLSGERTSFFILLLFIFLSLLTIKMEIYKKIAYLTFITIFLFLITTIIVKYSEEAKYRLIYQTISQINLNYKDTKTSYKEVIINGKPRVILQNNTLLPLQYHLYLKTSKKIFSDYFFLGSGPKTYKIISQEKKYMFIENHDAFKEEIKKNKNFHYPGYTNIRSANMHPHNIYLQLFSEVGIFGGIYILCIFILCLINVFKDLKFEKKLILNGIIVNLFPLFLSGNFFNNWISIIYFLPIGFLFLNKT